MTDINLKTLTPDTSLPTTGFLFGADSQSSTNPSVYSTQTVATTLLGSTSLTGDTLTASAPVLNLAQTWNNGAVTFKGVVVNATDTASAAASLLMDLQIAGTSKFSVKKDGSVSTGSWQGTAVGVAYGGTGQTTASAGFNALSPVTSTGDLIVGNGTNSSTRLGIGSTGQVLTVSGGTATWAAASAGAGTVTSVSVTTANGVSGTVATATTTPAISLSLGDITPTKVTVTESVGSSALVLTGATQTSSFPVLNATQTWNNVATTFKGVTVNITDTASAAASLLMDLQVGGTSKFKVDKNGALTLASAITATSGNSLIGPALFVTSGSPNALIIGGSSNLGFGSGGAAQDLYLIRKGAANLQLGQADAATPVAQTLSVQSVVAGQTNASAAAYPLTINGSQGTGTGAGGSIVFQVAPAGSTGTAQNALAAAMTIDSAKTVRLGAGYTVATLPAAGTAGRRTYVTDALAPTFLGTLTGGGSVVSPVFDNGTAWVSA